MQQSNKTSINILLQLKRLKEHIIPSLNQKAITHRIPTFEQVTRIPRIIHQTYPNKELPPAIQANVTEMQQNNPEWEYRLYDDKDIVTFINNNYGECVLALYESIDQDYGAARADLFRYLLIYKIGGIYLDIKSRPTKRLDDVIDPECGFIISSWHDDGSTPFDSWGKAHEDLNEYEHGELQQWHIVSAPGHPYLKAVIENVLQNITRYLPQAHGVGQKGVLRLTGPIAYTLAIAPIQNEHKHKIALARSTMGFEYSIYNKPKAHDHLFKNHYTKLRKSIVTLSTRRKLLNSLAGAIKCARRIYTPEKQ